MKKNKNGRAVKIAAIVLAVVLMLGLGGYLYIDNLAGTGDSGLLPDSVGTPDALKDNVVNLLVCGIDYEKDREYYGQKENGLTDTIIYASFDLKAGTVSVLQIPRDTYVGEEIPTGGSCKINSVYNHSTSKTSKIGALAQVLNDQFSLPVDYYIVIDMDAFIEAINALGGLEMYVPWDIVDKETGYTLSKGTQIIDGTTAKFIVQNRNYAMADIKRLDTQRYFYAAMFKKFKSLPISDIIKVMPAYKNYVDTDLSVAKLGSLASKVMKIDSANIFLCKLPGGGDSTGHWYTTEKQALAELLNAHFRPYSDPVPAEQLGAYALPLAGGLLADPGQYLSDLSAPKE